MRSRFKCAPELAGRLVSGLAFRSVSLSRPCLHRLVTSGCNGCLHRAVFTQTGATPPPVTQSEILSASEGMRGMMDYYAHATSTSAILERLAGLGPSMLACQHGSAYRGDGAALLRELATKIETGSTSSFASAAR